MQAICHQNVDILSEIEVIQFYEIVALMSEIRNLGGALHDMKQMS